jgi:hypothetical protein
MIWAGPIPRSVAGGPGTKELSAGATGSDRAYPAAAARCISEAYGREAVREEQPSRYRVRASPCRARTIRCCCGCRRLPATGRWGGCWPRAAARSPADRHMAQLALGGETGRRFRQIIARLTGPAVEMPASRATKPLWSAAWDALFDQEVGDHIHRLEVLGRVLREHLGLRAGIPKRSRRRRCASAIRCLPCARLLRAANRWTSRRRQTSPFGCTEPPASGCRGVRIATAGRATCELSPVGGQIAWTRPLEQVKPHGTYIAVSASPGRSR